jgi:uncharacterized protein (DUF1015 family)
MPSVKPFSAYRYDTSKVEPGRVVAPPYDVIDDRLRETLYRRDPRNVVRLILAKGDDPYADAASTATRWIDEGVLVRDPVPAVYFLEQAFTLPGGRMRRRSGFIAACRLEDFGGSVLPHEKTHSGPKEDRLRLMKATGMIFSQIFSLYSDPGGALGPLFETVEAGPPAMELLHDGVVNRLWVCTDEAAALTVTEFLRTRSVLIADGHHRYETALAFRDQVRLRNPSHQGNEPYNFVPMFFTNETDPGTVILPTHRLLRGVPGFSRDGFLGDVRKYFSVARQPSPEVMIERLESGPGREIGLAFPGTGECWLLRAGPGVARLLDGAPMVVSRIDAVLLHSAVFGSILGLSEESQEKKTNLDFERDESEVFRMLRHDARYQAAFFLKAPRVADVRAAAEAGVVLPQKTTFFYPKLLSGMVSCVVDEGATA